MNPAIVRRVILGALLTALALGGFTTGRAAGPAITLTLHMVARPGQFGRVAVTPGGNLCDVGGTNGLVQPNGDVTRDCTYQIDPATSVVLLANVPGASGTPGVFSNATGSAACGPFSACDFTLTQDTAVTATFDPATPTFTMTTIMAGDAGGEVGVGNSRCQNYDADPTVFPHQGSECATRYAQGSSVTIVAAPPAATRFTGFSHGTNGAAVCGGGSPCSFVLSADTTLTASFSSLTAVVVDPPSRTLGSGDTQPFTARGVYSDGSSASISPFHTGTWTTKSDMSQYRYSFGAAAVGNRIYAVGGNSAAGLLSSVESYDPSLNSGRGTWSDTGSSLPMPLAGFGIATSDDRYIYTAGGSAAGGCPVDALLRYDTSSAAWQQIGAMPGGARRFLTAAVVGRTLYAIGGESASCSASSGTALNTLEAYNLDTATWTTRASMPTARRFPAAGVVNGIIYVVGGDQAGDPSVSATVEAYDPATNTWSTKAPLPQGRSRLATGVMDGVLYVVGGSGSGVFTTSLFAYDASTGTWSQKQFMPAVLGAWTGTNGSTFGGERAEHAVASLGGRLYAMGGLGGTTATPQNVPIVVAFSNNLIWSSSNPAVASVDQNFQNGLAHALSVGSTNVMARSGAVACQPGACATLTVMNAPPAVTLGPPNPQTLPEGQQLFVTGSFSDQAADGPWTGTISYGDGSAVQSLGSFASTGSFTAPNHVYKDNGTFSATVSVTDRNGVTGSGTLQVIVTNAAPQVFLPATATQTVGNAASFLCATFNDAGVTDGPWTASVNYGDGTGPQSAAPSACGGGSPTGSFFLGHSYSRAGTFTTTVTVTDKDGASGQSSTVVTVNAAPIILNLPSAAATQTANPSSFGCGSFTDANGGAWTGTVNYGDGTGNQSLTLLTPSPSGPCPVSGGGTPPTRVFSFVHNYTTAGDFTLSTTITNTVTGGTKTASFIVTVSLAPIVVNTPLSASAPVNSTNTWACGSFTDPNNGPWTATISYGDATGTQSLPLSVPPSGPCAGTGGAAARGVFNLNHTYHAGGTFTVNATITNTFTHASKSFSVTVTVTVAPIVLGLPSNASIDTESANWGCGTFTDQNGGSWTGTINYGDGSGSQPLNLIAPPSGDCVTDGSAAAATGVFAFDHLYALPGHFTVSLTIRNTATGGTKTGSFDVDVAENRCAKVTLTVAGSVPFDFLPISLVVDGVDQGEGFFLTPGENVFQFHFGDEGSYHLGYLPPAGFVATPDHVDFTVCGPDISQTILISEADTTAPVLTLIGPATQRVEGHTPYVELGATAIDAIDGNVTASIVIDASAVDVNVVGTYSVRYSVTDAHGNTASTTRTVSVEDATVPTITLLGANPQRIEGHTPYVELGATAFDTVDGNLTAAITVDSSAVNTNTVGTYPVVYTVKDAHNNTASVTRTVSVEDATAPAITLLGANPQRIEGHTPYIELGATAFDTVDGNLTAAITIDSSAVNTNAVGAYPVVYTVKDAHNNTASVTRTVSVEDATVPTITLLGANPQRIEGHTPYVELGATAFDTVDGNLTAAITINTSAVNTNAVGTYTVVYTVRDAHNNTATVTRSVIVVDTTRPTLTLLGANPLRVEAGATFVDPGATAFDTVAGNLTAAIRVTGAVNTRTVGTYPLTYTVSDGFNSATATRTVTVSDTTPPLAACTAVTLKLQKGDDDDDDDDLGKGLYRVTASDAIGPLGLTIGAYTLSLDEIIQLSVKHQAGVVEITKTKKSAIRRFRVGPNDTFFIAKDAAGNATKAVCAAPVHSDHDKDDDDKGGKKDGKGDR